VEAIAAYGKAAYERPAWDDLAELRLRLNRLRNDIALMVVESQFRKEVEALAIERFWWDRVELNRRRFYGAPNVQMTIARLAYGGGTYLSFTGANGSRYSPRFPPWEHVAFESVERRFLDQAVSALVKDVVRKGPRLALQGWRLARSLTEGGDVVDPGDRPKWIRKTRNDLARRVASGLLLDERRAFVLFAIAHFDWSGYHQTMQYRLVERVRGTQYVPLKALRNCFQDRAVDAKVQLAMDLRDFKISEGLVFPQSSPPSFRRLSPLPDATMVGPDVIGERVRLGNVGNPEGPC
jgi:hypothetical protein